MLEVTEVRQDKGAAWFEESDAGAPRLSLILLTYGSCVYWVGGKKQVAEKGDMLLLDDSAVYYGKSIPSLVHEKFVVTFSVRSPRAEVATKLPILEPVPCRIWKTGIYELAAERLKLAFEQWREQLPCRETMALAVLLELLVHASREWARGVPSPDKTRLVEAMRAYIQLHHREPITKEQVGAAIERSPNHAATLYRQVTGRTIGESVHAARIKTAQYMLRHSLLTVAEVAEYVGYSDPSYFYRMFKRLAGQRPSELVAERGTSPE